jgi:hypothetical protein
MPRVDDILTDSQKGAHEAAGCDLALGQESGLKRNSDLVRGSTQ